MSTSQILVLRCDRCGYEQVADRDLQPDRAGWAVILGRSPGERTRVGGDDGTPADCCPGCGSAFFEWWREPAGPVEQPPQPAPPPSPILTLARRRKALALVVEALRVRTAFVHEVIRRQPTEMLNGDIVPGSLFEIEPAAAEIIDGVLAAFDIGRSTSQDTSSGERPVSLPLTDPDAPAASNAGVSAPQGRPVENGARGRQPEHPTP